MKILVELSWLSFFLIKNETIFFEAYRPYTLSWFSFPFSLQQPLFSMASQLYPLS